MKLSLNPSFQNYFPLPKKKQAVINGNREIAEYLLEKTDRAVTKAVDRDGRSALHYAAAFSPEDDCAMFGWLMQMGADKSQADNVSWTLLYFPGFKLPLFQNECFR
jgi:ankyrin repeat protein